MAEPRWLEFSRQVEDSRLGSSRAERICHVASSLLGAVEVSISLFVDNAYLSLATSGSLALLLDETQFQLGDGPVFESQNSTVPVVVEDISSSDARLAFPAFGPIAHEKKIGSIAVFPVRVGNAKLGTLNVYRERVGPLGAEQYANGLIAASFALTEAIDQQAGVIASVSTGEIPHRFASSHLQIAAGMVAESLGCSIVESLVLIRARAFADSVPVVEIAKQIQERKLMLGH
jgi:GAF domain-containing protein